MAGVLDDMLGGDGADSESATAEIASVAGAEAVAATIAMNQAGYGPGVAKAAESFLKSQEEVLRKQARHIDVQTRQLEEENHLRTRLLQGQHLSQRLRIALQLFGALVFTGIGLALVVMIYDAATSQSVVVEAFDAPPALAARGLTGKVIAGGVLDALTRLQATTKSSAQRRDLANAWTNDIKVEVPETGVSISDVERALKARLGHDIHIDGDLVQTDSGGLALTIRGDGILPKTFGGGPTDLAKLTTQAAEYVYGQSQPALYATYLSNVGRDNDSIAFAKSAYATASAADRPYLLNDWGIGLQNLGAPPKEIVPFFAEAVKQKADFWVGYNNIMNVDLGVGDEEGAWREGEALRRAAGGRPGRAPETYYQNSDLVTWNLLPWLNSTIEDIKAHAGIGSSATDSGPALADVDQRLHDSAAAEIALQTSPAGSVDPTIPVIAHFVRGRIAGDAGDVRKAAAEMEAFEAGFGNPVVSSNYPGYNCWIAPAEEAAGHTDKADAVLKSAGRFVDCYRFRGDILDHRGDWAGAQKAYAAAVGIAPDLPAAYYSWGVALARHGDLSAAQAKLAAAHTRGPNWADPLKALGDVLAREGRWKDSLAKYDEALRDAPNWAALHQARDVASRRAGESHG